MSKFKFRPRDGKYKLIICYEEDEYGIRIAKGLLHHLEDNGYTCIFRGRDAEPGDKQYENARKFISESTLLIGLMTQDCQEGNFSWTEYEIALGMDYHRDIILIPFADVKIRELFSCISRTKIYSPETTWYPAFMDMVDISMKNSMMLLDILTFSIVLTTRHHESIYNSDHSEFKKFNQLQFINH